MVRTVLPGALLVLALAGATPVRAHEVFRFVGTVIKWDPKKEALDILSREKWGGKAGEYKRHLVLRDDCKVWRDKKPVSRAQLKPGLFVVVDAVGVDINDLEATDIDIKPKPVPAIDPQK
jgi:hypothetical protein